MPDHIVICGDCMSVNLESSCIFADPPDNIGLGYDGYDDSLPHDKYIELMRSWVFRFCWSAPTVWLSFNAKHTLDVADIARLVADKLDLIVRPCVQVFTFGQQRSTDFTNCYRPLWRFQWADLATFNPDNIKIKSWRQKHGDKRAAPGGKAPSDVFDFPRVTGNSKQRRRWHPTQLHEGLVERAIKSCTDEGQLVVDPFAGTGTVARVCKRIGRRSLSVEINQEYCDRIAEELYGHRADCAGV